MSRVCHHDDIHVHGWAGSIGPFGILCARYCTLGCSSSFLLWMILNSLRLIVSTFSCAAASSLVEKLKLASSMAGV